MSRIDNVIDIAHSERPYIDNLVRQHNRLHQWVATCFSKPRHNTANIDIGCYRASIDEFHDLGPVYRRR